MDEYLKQSAIVNPHLQLHYRVSLRSKEESGEALPGPWTRFSRIRPAAAELICRQAGLDPQAKPGLHYVLEEDLPRKLKKGVFLP
ncbi:MAG: hypothetical protein R6X19_02960 [Kiritimatiellia bacterium]